MAVTAESQSQYLAFRRFIYSLSRQLSEDEVQAIVYIHFFDQKDSLKAASTLDILCKLESSGVATSTHPEKLLELMKDLKRNDLVSEVKEFLKKRKVKPSERKSMSLTRKLRTSVPEDITEVESEEDLELRNTLEAAIVQATVLLQHMEMIQNSISVSKIEKGRIRELVTEAAQTSEALAERLRRAEVRANLEEGGQSFPLAPPAPLATAPNPRLSGGSSGFEKEKSAEFVPWGYVNAVHKGKSPFTDSKRTKLRKRDMIS